MIETKTTTPEELKFLSESNLIEEVLDEDSLQQAVYAWEYLKEQKVLDVHTVLHVHKILMLHQNLLPYEKGYFRTEQVYVGGREGLEHHKINSAMMMWCFEGLKTKTKEDAIRRHIKYEIIHGFIDGNGRTGRMFLNWELTVRCKQPIMIIRAEQRGDYYKWFK